MIGRVVTYLDLDFLWLNKVYITEGVGGWGGGYDYYNTFLCKVVIL